MPLWAQYKPATTSWLRFAPQGPRPARAGFTYFAGAFLARPYCLCMLCEHCGDDDLGGWVEEPTLRTNSILVSLSKDILHDFEFPLPLEI